MKKHDIIDLIFKRSLEAPANQQGSAFAPTNIAFIKYWGKRNQELNLPYTNSFSVALPNKGSSAHLALNNQNDDCIILNNELLDSNTSFAKRLIHFIDLFRPQKKWHLNININMNIAVAAGLASSACGFASIVKALDKLFAWQLPLSQLSILARLGSGSASRSLYNGFVEWHAGEQENGMDCYATPYEQTWPDLKVGILPINLQPKSLSSREAMQRTVQTSPLYTRWTETVSDHLLQLKKAISEKDFLLLGRTVEMNAMTMHAIMLSSWPAVCYYLPETMIAMHKIWQCREKGVNLFFTQDAGPNLKLIFLANETKVIQQIFPTLEIISLF